VIRILLVALVATLSACALPGKPGPIAARDQCVLDAHGLRCTEVLAGPGAVLIQHE
jgi:hypothetical protein